MPPNKMILRFKNKQQEADDIYSFYFAPKATFNFLPGQYIYLTIPELKNDYRGPTRHFTISSSPDDKHLRITTNIRKKSAFKQSLMQLETDDELEASGPTGTFILDEEEPGDHVLIAGGIGITPFISILKYNIQQELKKNFTMIYSVRSEQEGAFIGKLDNWADDNRNIKLFMTYTDKKPKGKEAYDRRIDKKMLNEIIEHQSSKKYWLCGPPEMVTAMEKLIDDTIDVPVDIISEKFTGY